jgi:dynactin-4
VQVGDTAAKAADGLLSADNNPTPSHGPYALFCQYCNWSSSEIGLEFDRPSGIPSQLAKVRNGGEPKLTARDVKERRKENPDEPPVPDGLVDTDMQFANLKAFYQGQLSDAGAGGIGGLSLGDNVGFSSPAALSRIMSLYTTGRGQHNRQQGAPDIMREALTTDDGLKLVQLDESAAVKKLLHGGWDETVSQEQRLAQLEPARFQDELRPTQCILRTKRSKRCAVCRHIISKPENKVGSTRFKIRLVAKAYIPSITIRPLRPTSGGIPVGLRPDVPKEPPLKPLAPYQYILTFTNPLFESIKVTLATPNNTPGRFSSKVTLLCPQFEVNANTDIWEDALRDDDKDRRRGEEGNGQPEPGKIFERGRNWVSIVLEVIPPSLRVEHLTLTAKPDDVDTSPLKEDEDILEIPMFVRMEWEAEAQNEIGSTIGKDKESKEKRELAYWCVLGVGRISHE